MKYILNENIALRGWRLVPFALQRKWRSPAQKLTPEEYYFLAACDGETEQSNPSEERKALIERFCKSGIIREAKEGEQLTDWQKPRYCDNRYFLEANWAITGKCTFNCKHCFMAADNARLVREFSREQWQKTIEELDKCGIQTLTITGGEPTIHPDFMEIMREIHRRGMRVEYLNTNGAAISHEMLEEFRAMGADPMMKISFDGLGHHDWMRGKKGAEEEALRAIDLCLEHGFRVYIQTCIHRHNLDTLFETAEMLAKKGVSEMRIIRTSESLRWKQNAGDACLGLLEYYDLMLEFAERYAATGLPMKLDMWLFMRMDPKHKTYHYRPVRNGCYRDSMPVCPDTRHMLAINSDGSLVPCNQISGGLEKHGWDLGNVHRDGLQKLLQESGLLRTVTCSLGTMHEHNKACIECPWRKLCAGGCRAMAFSLTLDYLGVDPTMCAYFRNGYMQKTDAVFARVAQKTGIVYQNVDGISEDLKKVDSKK